MKTFSKFSEVPAGASYIGSSEPDGSVTEELVDYIDAANELACYVDAEGIKHYFDLS